MQISLVPNRRVFRIPVSYVMASGKRSLTIRGREATGAEDHTRGSNIGDLGPARQGFDQGGRRTRGVARTYDEGF